MRESSLDQQMWPPDIGVKRCVEVIWRGVLGCILECSVASIVDNNVDLAAWESFDNGPDQVFPKCSGASVGLDGDDFDPQGLKNGDHLFRGRFIGVISEYKLSACQQDQTLPLFLVWSLTSAPALARPWAVANPMPLRFEAPVIMANLPWKLLDMMKSYYLIKPNS